MDVVERKHGDRRRLMRVIAKGSDAMQRDRLRSVLLVVQGRQALEVYAARAYFHDHHDSIVAAIEVGKARAERARGPDSISREELLRRRAAAHGRNE